MPFMEEPENKQNKAVSQNQNVVTAPGTARRGKQVQVGLLDKQPNVTFEGGTSNSSRAVQVGLLDSPQLVTFQTNWQCTKVGSFGLFDEPQNLVFDWGSGGKTTGYQEEKKKKKLGQNFVNGGGGFGNGFGGGQQSVGQKNVPNALIKAAGKQLACGSRAQINIPYGNNGAINKCDALIYQV